MTIILASMVYYLTAHGSRLKPHLPHHPPSPRVQPIVYPVSELQQCGVILYCHAESSDDGVHAGRLRGSELFIIEIGIVHDGRDLVQGRIPQLVDLEECFKGTATLMMTEFHATHVKWRSAQSAGGIGVSGKDEFRLLIDEPPNEPGAGGPVDVGPGSSHPSHASLLRVRGSAAVARFASSRR